MRNKLFMGILIAVVIPLTIWGSTSFMGLIDTPTNVTQNIDTLVGNDSTACFPWNGKVMMVTVGPGRASGLFINAASAADSYKTHFFLRGWTTANRTQLMFQTTLWGTTASYDMFKMPRANTWLNAVSTSPADSATKIVFSDKTPFSSGTAAGVNATDSLRLATLYLGNKIISEFAPYYDIVKCDSTGKTGKNHTVKITITQYKDGR